MKDETAGGDIAVSEAGSVKRSGHESYGDAQRTTEPVEKENEAGKQGKFLIKIKLDRLNVLNVLEMQKSLLLR